MSLLESFHLKSKIALVFVSILAGLLFTDCLQSAIMILLSKCVLVFVGILILLLFSGCVFAMFPISGCLCLIIVIIIFLLGKYENRKSSQNVQKSEPSAIPPFPWKHSQEKEGSAKEECPSHRHQNSEALLFVCDRLQRVLPEDCWSEWLQSCRACKTAGGISIVNCSQCNASFFLCNSEIAKQENQEKSIVCQECLNAC